MNAALLHRLIASHEAGRLIGELSPEERPASLDEAYATADALARRIGGEVVGWKIGASAERGQRALGLTEPFAGRVFAGTLQTSPAVVAPPTGEALTIGAEFGFRLRRDLMGDRRDYDARSIADEVDALAPVLELNRVSYAKPMVVGGWGIVADNGFNAGLVVGPMIEAWQELPLATWPVAFSVDGELRQSGCAAEAGFAPLDALAWLANDRARRGNPLRAGQLVATGDLVGAIEARAGSVVIADFGSLGRVSCTLVTAQT